MAKLEAEAASTAKKILAVAEEAERIVGIGNQANKSADPLRRLQTVFKKLKDATRKNDESELQKELDSLKECYKKAMDDVDCLRKDRERQREDVERLKAQLEKLRSEKTADKAERKNKRR